MLLKIKKISFLFFFIKKKVKIRSSYHLFTCKKNGFKFCYYYKLLIIRKTFFLRRKTLHFIEKKIKRDWRKEMETIVKEHSPSTLNKPLICLVYI